MRFSKKKLNYVCERIWDRFMEGEVNLIVGCGGIPNYVLNARQLNFAPNSPK